MIAQASWFSPRKFGGWGLTPNCWQGWAYIGTIVLLIFAINNLNLPGNWSLWLMISLAIMASVDFIDIFIHLKKDERDVIHEAIAERNAMWFMVMALGMGVAYQSAISATTKSIIIDPVIIIALIGSVVVKGITHWYLHDK